MNGPSPQLPAIMATAIMYDGENQHAYSAIMYDGDNQHAYSAMMYDGDNQHALWDVPKQPTCVLELVALWWCFKERQPRSCNGGRWTVPSLSRGECGDCLEGPAFPQLWDDKLAKDPALLVPGTMP